MQSECVGQRLAAFDGPQNFENNAAELLPCREFACDRKRAIELGANAYITKQIQAPQVVAKVKELLKIVP